MIDDRIIAVSNMLMKVGVSVRLWKGGEDCRR